MKRKLLIGAIIITFILAALAVINLIRTANKPMPKNFVECEAAGYPIRETFPEQCATPDGTIYVKDAVIGTPGEMSGEIVCLPHKKSDGPQTLECVFGLKATGNKHYALIDPRGKHASELQTGKNVQVIGILLPAEKNSTYDTVGSIEISSIKQ